MPLLMNHTMNIGRNQNRNRMKYNRIIAIKERSAGNESVGEMWLTTKSFHINTPIKEVMDWALQQSKTGKLIIQIDEDETDRPF